METSKLRILAFAAFAVLIAATLYYLAVEGAGAEVLLAIATFVQ